MTAREQELARLARRDARKLRTHDPVQTGADACFVCGGPVGAGNIGACDDCYQAFKAREREMEADFWLERGL